MSINDNNSFSPILQSNGELTKHDMIYSFKNDNNNNFTSDLSDNSIFVNNTIKKINMAKGAKGILYLDISNFYGSIYTHFLPTIPLGYEEANKQYTIFKSNQQNSSEKYKIYRSLDEKIRSLNSNQTNGLLVGPLISRFIAEALLCRIDIEILHNKINFVRYVDDFEIFIYNEQDTEKISNNISSIFNKYNFTLNNEKTKYAKFPYYIVESLEKIFQKNISNSLNSEELNNLFNTFFLLENNGVKGAIKYLVKSINNDISISDSKLYTSYLLNILVNDNRAFQKVCNLIITEKENLIIDNTDINIIVSLLKQHISNKNHLETIWLLYLLKNLGQYTLDNELINLLINSKNDIAIIILIEEYKKCLSSEMMNLCIQNAESWILLYQLYLRNLISDNTFETKFKHNLSIYKKLKYKNFTFYKKIIN